jgi:hypothetical protein
MRRQPAAAASCQSRATHAASAGPEQKLEREHDDGHDERFGGIVAARAIG